VPKIQKALKKSHKKQQSGQFLIEIVQPDLYFFFFNFLGLEYTFLSIKTQKN